jgi:carbonic anhydrase/acetyltransferase-like protein (isoleucine patch superfamily)
MRDGFQVLFAEWRRLYFNKIWGMDIGRQCRIALSAKLDPTNPRGVHIGDSTAIDFRACILTHDQCRSLVADTWVGKKCHIGAQSIIMPGVSIGDNCVIAAASVVTRDVPSNCVAAGIPAHRRDGNSNGAAGCDLSVGKFTRRRLMTSRTFAGPVFRIASVRRDAQRRANAHWRSWSSSRRSSHESRCAPRAHPFQPRGLSWWSAGREAPRRWTRPRIRGYRSRRRRWTSPPCWSPHECRQSRSLPRERRLDGWFRTPRALALARRATTWRQPKSRPKTRRFEYETRLYRP